MGTYSLLTWYYASSSSVEEEQLHFERVGVERLDVWYTRFGHLRTLRQNEALLGALVTATDDGFSMAVGDGCVHLFVNGDFPAAYMGMPLQSHCVDLTIAGDDIDSMAELLSTQRIAYTPHLLNGYFINGEGATLDPGDVDIRFQASTLEAAEAMAKWEFEDCESFFGEEIVGMSRKAPQA